ncbi:hypothetical protein MPSEU_000909300 [Mayamaea pseudoterrestris]|nr:hypothetical protein MPSEU_000909300 [Mayamaea pseudoterrestris]
MMSVLAQKVVVKLGVEKKDGDDVIYRRVNLSHHAKYNENLFHVLKLYAVQTYSNAEVLPTSIAGYRINFIYLDTDGDKVMIGSSEELMDALKMHEPKGSIKIMAGVEQRDGIEDPDGRSVASSVRVSEVPASEPTVAAAPAPCNVSGSSFIQDAPPHIQHVLESVIAQIASIPAVMHLQVRGSGPSRAAEASNATAAASAATVDASLTAESQPLVEPDRPFIHGRHTCDGCLTTPIIGQRFHAVNMPDYDLCANCRNNYKGDVLQFEPVELDRDRAFQERWHRRHGRWGQLAHQNPPRCGPSHNRHGFPHHGPHHVGPHHHQRPGRHGRCGPHRRWGRGPDFGCVSMQEGPSREEVDLALKEAIRRSLSDLKKPDDGVVDGNTENVTSTLQNDGSDEKAAAPVVVPSAPVESTENESTIELPVIDIKTDVTLPKQLVDKPVLMEEVAPKATPSAPPASPSKMSDTSFEDEAEGNGDIAKLVGSTLDKFAAAIDDFNNEFDRALVSDASSEEGEIVIAPAKGAEIVEAEDASDDEELSQGSWVVDEEQFANDEGLARAAHVIGSALFQSDMIHSQSQSNSSSSDGPSLTPSNISVPTNPGSVNHAQMDRWTLQLNELHGMGLDDDAKLIDILERLAAANLGSECDEEVTTERVVDEYYK